MSALPATVRIVEVGPRDGLQNEPQPLATADKIRLIERLANSGLAVIEAGSFVSPKWVPQMADSAEVFAGLTRQPQVRYTALTPNLQGLERALAAGADEVAVFAAASEAFSQKNINCSIADSVRRFEPVMAAARDAGVLVRGYVSCVLGCPYQGAVEPDAVLRVSEALRALGCYEISLGDTIGVGTPGAVRRLLDHLRRDFPTSALAMHCHDTYGQALANVVTALDYGISTVDASVAGLGGCPYAHGASGNLATEDLVYMLHGMGIDTGVDLPALVATGQWISDRLSRRNNSRVGVATLADGHHR